MGNEINKDDIAELIIYSDAIEEILSKYNFRHSSKFEFNKVSKAVKNIISAAFGNNGVGELDDFVYELRIFTQGIIKDKVYLRE